MFDASGRKQKHEYRTFFQDFAYAVTNDERNFRIREFLNFTSKTTVSFTFRQWLSIHLRKRFGKFFNLCHAKENTNTSRRLDLDEIFMIKLQTIVADKSE